MKILLIKLIFLLTIGCTNTKFYHNMDNINAPFDGKKFDNTEPFPDKSIAHFMKWRYHALKDSVPWPKRKNNKIFKSTKIRSEELQISVINHATVLIQMNGINF